MAANAALADTKEARKSRNQSRDCELPHAAPSCPPPCRGQEFDRHPYRNQEVTGRLVHRFPPIARDGAALHAPHLAWGPCPVRQAKVHLDRSFTIGRADPRLFGAFVEHLGRGVYGGLYEPGHPTADEQGFRRDVLDLVEELGPTIVKYPGGNFVSTYRWEDGVGPVEKRPKRPELRLAIDRTQYFRRQRIHRLVPPCQRRAHARCQPRHA